MTLACSELSEALTALQTASQIRYEHYAVRYRPTGSIVDQWATVEVRLPD